MIKPIFKLSLVLACSTGILALAPLAAPAQDFLSETQKLLDARQDKILSFMEYTDLELVSSQIHEERYDKAHERLQPLLAAHPDYTLLYLYQGAIHLGKKEAMAALAAYQSAETKAGDQIDQFVQARLGQARAYAMQEEYERALGILTEVNLDSLKPRLIEQVFYQQAWLHRRRGNLIQMQEDLQRAIAYGNNGTPARQDLDDFREEFAKARFELGLRYMQEKAFGKAVQSLREANALVPDDPQYIAALDQVNQEFMQILSGRVQQMLPVITPILTDMSNELRMENYAEAYKHYRRLMGNEHMHFFVSNNYTAYLPRNMQGVLKETAELLRIEGFEVGSDL